MKFIKKKPWEAKNNSFGFAGTVNQRDKNSGDPYLFKFDHKVRICVHFSNIYIPLVHSWELKRSFHQIKSKLRVVLWSPSHHIFKLRSLNRNKNRPQHEMISPFSYPVVTLGLLQYCKLPAWFYLYTCPPSVTLALPCPCCFPSLSAPFPFFGFLLTCILIIIPSSIQFLFKSSFRSPVHLFLTFILNKAMATHMQMGAVQDVRHTELCWSVVSLWVKRTHTSVLLVVTAFLRSKFSKVEHLNANVFCVFFAPLTCIEP